MSIVKVNARFSTLNVHLLLQTCVYFVNSPKKYFTETWIRNARLFEKTQNRSSAGKRTSEPIIIDGKMNEKSWKNTEFITGYPGNTAPPANPADIFAKLLFDEKYIYLAISGTAPVENEKWSITFPDHKRLAVPLKQFDLDKITPFAKEKKKNVQSSCFIRRKQRYFEGFPAYFSKK